MLSEVVNALFLTYVATEYTLGKENESHTVSKWRWRYGGVVVVLLVNVADRYGAMLVRVGSTISTVWKVPLVMLLYVSALYLDCQTTRKWLQLPPLGLFSDFLPRVTGAFLRVLPIYPIAAVFISFIFLWVIHLFEFLHLPVELLNWPIYYGTLYGPFSYIYMLVKQSVVRERALPV